MKRTVYLLIGIFAFSLFSCDGQSGNNPQKQANKKVQTSNTVNVAGDGNLKPVHITKAEFLKLVMDYEKNPNEWMFQGQKPCLIDFYADWCAPCRITSPILEDLAGHYAGKIDIYKVDIDDEQELAAVFGIQSIPTFLFCPIDGKPTISSGIANSPSATKDLFIRQIEELLLKNTESSSGI